MRVFKFNYKISLTYGISILLVLLVTSFPMLAQTSGIFEISWHTIDGGGGESSGGNYALTGIIGQSDAGVLMSGDDYTMTGGFWEVGDEPVISPGGGDVYLPLVIKDN